jgi:hypothetical protein
MAPKLGPDLVAFPAGVLRTRAAGLRAHAKRARHQMQLLSSGSTAEMQLRFCAEWFDSRAKEAEASADAERLRNLGPAFPELPKGSAGGIASSGGSLLQLLHRVGTSTRRSGSFSTH